jgi:LPXTG-motif cell wall-anchored protein
MKRIRLGGSVSLGALLVLVVGATALMAGDSPYFTSEANVTRAQQILVDDGYLDQGSFDTGSLDAATRDALKQYQSEHAMNDRGFLDEETFQSLTSHENSYPWGGAPRAVPMAAAEPAEEVEVAEAPAVPEPAPAPEEQKEAVVAQAEPKEAAPAPAMPATGSNLPLLALSGLALLGTGVLLLKRSA